MKKKKRNMQDVPLSWYQSVTRRLRHLEKTVEAQNKVLFIVESVLHQTENIIHQNCRIERGGKPAKNVFPKPRRNK